MPRPARRWTRAVLGGLVVAAVTLGVAEGMVRAARPRPRVQIVREASALHALEVVDGVPLWRSSDQDDRIRGEDCPGPDTVDVALAGDSVFYEIEAGATSGRLSDLLREAWADRAPRVCVLDLSQPAYRPYQQLAEARRAHDRHGLDLVLVGAWKPAAAYTRIGAAWYQVDDREVDALGTPRLPWVPMPAPLRRALFERSRLFEYASLALAPTVPSAAPGYADLAAWAAEAGVDAVFLDVAPLDRPFAETARMRAQPDPSPGRARRDLTEGAKAHGFPLVDAAALLADEEVEALRLDTCCHLTTRGHRALARRLLPVLEPRLQAVVDRRLPRDAPRPVEARDPGR